MVKVDLHKIYSKNYGIFEGASTRSPNACLRGGYRHHLDIKKGILIASLNINGLRCHFEEIQLLLEDLGIHVMALNETKLDPEYPRELTSIPGYEHEQRERTCRGGGVSVYIRDSVRYTRRCDLPENNLELICIEIKPLKCRPFLVVAWYRPPNDPVASFDKLEQILNFLDREDKEIILIGDTNCDFSQHNKEQPLDNNNTKHICNIYELFSFKQLSITQQGLHSVAQLL